VKRLLRFLHRDHKTVMAPPAARSPDIGVLGLDSRVLGHIVFQGTLTVDGAVSGDVRSPEGSGAMLVVGQSATIRGDIVSDAVLIGGSVTGSVKARQRVEIYGTGMLHGDIETGAIMIQGGAEFQGRCQMVPEAPGERAGIGGMRGPQAHGEDGDAARHGRQAKATPGERPGSGAAGERGAIELSGERGAVRQDSRTERGNTTEGPSA
jgi:cytoskeletal protein CcmA (bactofilin family)